MITKRLLYFLIAFCTLISLTDCSVQKRKYRSGWHVASHAKVRNTAQADPAGAKSNPQTAGMVAKEIFAQSKVAVVAPEHNISVASAAFASSQKAKVESTRLPADSCDLLIYKDGSEIRAKVLEILPETVKYKACGDNAGETMTVRKSELFMIKYYNGMREVFKSEQSRPSTEPSSTPRQNPVPNYPEYTPKTVPTSAILSLVFGLSSLLLSFLLIPILLFIPAIILGNRALAMIRSRPDLYEGIGIALAGKIMGLIVLGIILLSLFLFFLLIALI